MITRSRRDSTYEFIELHDKKRVKKVPENTNTHYYEYDRPPLYDVNIDFDEAHVEWVKNKIRLPNGCYKYKKEKQSKRHTL
jgi:hypothetical protein